ncbi:MAG: T9SS type A sorting domain-containing protein, partial [Fimbriimonadaceae bacterium]|nr:T9SS type A sorting domain-containing protein [Chitinophagales bacterium]
FPFDLTATSDDINSDGMDFVLAKMSGDGDYLWAKSISVTETVSIFSGGLTLDDESNVYITGTYSGTIDLDPGAGIASFAADSMYDLYIAKYDEDGNYVWGISPVFKDGTAMTIESDADGNIYVGGTFRSTVDFDPGAGEALRTVSGYENTYLAKYDTDGNFLWVITIECDGNPRVWPMAIDDEGSIYIHGVNRGSADFDPSGAEVIPAVDVFDYMFFAKYNSEGDLLFVKTLQGFSNLADSYAIAVDDEHNIYLTGKYYGSIDMDPGLDEAIYTSEAALTIFLGKYNASGDYVWSHSFGDVWLNENFGKSLMIDGDELILMGSFMDEVDFDPGVGEHVLITTLGISEDIFVASYDLSTGNFNWAGQVRGGGGEPVCSMIRDPQGNYLLQIRADTETDFDITSGGVLTPELDDPFGGMYVAKYEYSSKHTDVSVTEHDAVNIFPNPVQDMLFVSNANCDEMKISLLNSLGQIIYTGKFTDHISISFANLPQGIYFLQMSANEGVILKKINKI